MRSFLFSYSTTWWHLCSLRIPLCQCCWLTRRRRRDWAFPTFACDGDEPLWWSSLSTGTRAAEVAAAVVAGKMWSRSRLCMAARGRHLRRHSAFDANSCWCCCCWRSGRSRTRPPPRSPSTIAAAACGGSATKIRTRQRQWRRRLWPTDTSAEWRLSLSPWNCSCSRPPRAWTWCQRGRPPTPTWTCGSPGQVSWDICRSIVKSWVKRLILNYRWWKKTRSDKKTNKPTSSSSWVAIWILSSAFSSNFAYSLIPEHKYKYNWQIEYLWPFFLGEKKKKEALLF